MTITVWRCVNGILTPRGVLPVKLVRVSTLPRSTLQNRRHSGSLKLRPAPDYGPSGHLRAHTHYRRNYF